MKFSEAPATSQPPQTSTTTTTTTSALQDLPQVPQTPSLSQQATNDESHPQPAPPQQRPGPKLVRGDRLQHFQLNQNAQSEAAQRVATDNQAAATARAVQAQHQHIQLQNLLLASANNGGHYPMNGMNGAGAGMQGGGGIGAGGVGGGGVNAAGAAMAAVGPTPAGHQAELNIIYGLVEELSRQLAENRRQTEDIVAGIGRVRSRAVERGLGNDELLGEAADEIYGQETNIDALLSILTESLDRAKTSRDANFTLLTSYARVLSALLGQFHAYKQRHVADVSAWHASYRSQLAEARAENSRLREQIWDMQDRAGRANAMLRDFRRAYDDDAHPRAERRVEERARRQELRFWKRMAMPERGGGDGEGGDGDEAFWSDDDDIVDPVEKERLREVERKVAEQAQAGLGSADSQQGEDSEGEEGGGGGGGQMHHGGGNLGMLGGVAMERDGSLPTPPPRPASTGSAGGQTG